MESIERLNELLEAERAGGRDPDFAARVLAEGSLRGRLRLLDRGQGSGVSRLDEALERDRDGESRAFLGEMRAVHRRNIDRCDGLIAALEAPPCKRAGTFT